MDFDDSPRRSTFAIKSVDEDQRIIEGIASTPELDRQGDSMDPAGAKFKLPLVLFWQHKHDQPIGNVISAQVTPQGIKVRAQIEPKGLDPIIDRAWNLIKAKLVRGFSIDWKPLEPPTIKDGAYRYTKWEWLGLSAVSIPANASASIQLVKSLDTSRPAASGTARSVAVTPGVTGSSKATSMNVSEQLTSAREELQTKSLRLQELIDGDGAEGGLESAEQTELDTLTKEVGTITQKISRLSTLEAAQAVSAKGISYPAPARVQSASTPRIEVVDHAKELPKGTLFARYAMAVAAGKGSYSDTILFAKKWDAQTPQVSAYIKAVAGTAVQSSPAWGYQLVQNQVLVSEFIELLRAATIMDKIRGLRKVPFNILLQMQTGGSTVNWVGEAAAKPVGELEFDTFTMLQHKIAGIVVLTEELVRSSNPDAEQTVRQDLVEQITRFMDSQFIDTAVTATANRPASITNGVSAPNASGTTATHLFNDLNTALGTFDNANNGTENVHILTTPALARGISTLRNALGQTEQGIGVTPTGGTLMGFPVIVSSAVPSGHLILVKADEILVADDGRVSLDASNQATLDLAGGDTPTFNLWQKNCIGIRAERFITWKKRRSSAVAMIDNAAYAPS